LLSVDPMVGLLKSLASNISLICYGGWTAVWRTPSGMNLICLAEIYTVWIPTVLNWCRHFASLPSEANETFRNDDDVVPHLKCPLIDYNYFHALFAVVSIFLCVMLMLVSWSTHFRCASVQSPPDLSTLFLDIVEWLGLGIGGEQASLYMLRF
jgi:ABC-type transport system involved in Fe-S cluster assembly fused permease/ATPase subunit